jgi:hypothetical protein
MTHRANENVVASPRGRSNTRFADLHNQEKPRWRDALRALASPATRVHRYRNLHKSMFYEALCELDCKDKK